MIFAFACDTDHDRHGIVTRSAGLLPPNHYLSVAIFYLFQNRPKWRREAAVGKTVVSSQMIDRVTTKVGRKLYEVPVGFKWFVDGLLDGSLGFGGEESAGASFSRLDGSVWTTDKDGIVPALLSAEITARMGRDPGEIYRELTREFGEPAYDRVEAPATPEQKELLAKLSPAQVKLTELAGEKIQSVLTHAPGNGAPIGGLKVAAENGWFAARPSGTENIYKIYGESFRGADHLAPHPGGSAENCERHVGCCTRWISAEKGCKRNVVSPGKEGFFVASPACRQNPQNDGRGEFSSDGQAATSALLLDATTCNKSFQESMNDLVPSSRSCFSSSLTSMPALANLAKVCAEDSSRAAMMPPISP